MAPVLAITSVVARTSWLRFFDLWPAISAYARELLQRLPAFGISIHVTQPCSILLILKPEGVFARHRQLSAITPKILAEQLREMERDGLLQRRVYLEVPPRVEYQLTPRGKTLEPVIDAMCAGARGSFARDLPIWSNPLAAAVAMPWLASQKRKSAVVTSSAALKADAAESALCGYMAWIALLQGSY